MSLRFMIVVYTALTQEVMKEHLCLFWWGITHMFGFPNVVTEASIGRPAPTRNQPTALPKFTRLMNIVEVNVNIFASSF